MQPLEIQFELKKRGTTQLSLAKELGVAHMSVSKVINKKMISDRIMRHVAAAIGKHHTEVFPEYYFSPPARSTSKTAVG